MYSSSHPNNSFFTAKSRELITGKVKPEHIQVVLHCKKNKFILTKTHIDIGREHPSSEGWLTTVQNGEVKFFYLQLVPHKFAATCQPKVFGPSVDQILPSFVKMELTTCFEMANEKAPEMHRPCVSGHKCKIIWCYAFAAAQPQEIWSKLFLLRQMRLPDSQQRFSKIQFWDLGGKVLAIRANKLHMCDNSSDEEKVIISALTFKLLGASIFILNLQTHPSSGLPFSYSAQHLIMKVHDKHINF